MSSLIFLHRFYRSNSFFPNLCPSRFFCFFGWGRRPLLSHGLPHFCQSLSSLVFLVFRYVSLFPKFYFWTRYSLHSFSHGPLLIFGSPYFLSHDRLPASTPHPRFDDVLPRLSLSAHSRSVTLRSLQLVHAL